MICEIKITLNATGGVFASDGTMLKSMSEWQKEVYNLNIPSFYGDIEIGKKYANMFCNIYPNVVVSVEFYQNSEYIGSYTKSANLDYLNID